MSDSCRQSKQLPTRGAVTQATTRSARGRPPMRIASQPSPSIFLPCGALTDGNWGCGVPSTGTGNDSTASPRQMIELFTSRPSPARPRTSGRWLPAATRLFWRWQVSSSLRRSTSIYRFTTGPAPAPPPRSESGVIGHKSTFSIPLSESDEPVSGADYLRGNGPPTPEARHAELEALGTGALSAGWFPQYRDEPRVTNRD